MSARSLLAVSLFLSILIAGQVHAQPTAEFAWRPLYGPHGGTVAAIASDDAGTLYAGSGDNQHGVYRSTDGGFTWEQKSSGIALTDRTVDCIVMADSGHVLIGTNSHTGSRIYRSVDQGETWTETGVLASSAFALTPEGHILVANTGYGTMHLSTDNGHTWEPVAMPLGLTDDIVINDSGHVFVGGWGFQRSRDGGQTWTGMDVGGNVRSIAIDAEGRVYAGNWGDQDSNSGIFRSEDNGDTWTPLKLGFRVNRNRNIAFTAEGHILAGSWGQGIWKSTDDGATWNQSNDGLGHLTLRHLYVTADGIVLAGTDGGGVYRSEDGGESWTQVGITVASAMKLAISPVTGDLFALVVGMARSSDGGETWVPINSGLTNLDLRSFAIAPDGTLYAGGAGLVYRSDDNGDTWVSASNGISSHVVEAVGVAPDGTAYAANYVGVFKSSDRGETWTLADGFSGVRWIDFNAVGDLFAASWGQGMRRRLHGQEAWDVLNIGFGFVSPLYVGSSGFVYAGGSRSEDNGDTWAEIGYRNTVAGFVENSLGQLFAATTNYGNGVHRSTNHGETWERVNAGIPANDIRAITVDTDDYLYASVFRYSVYKTVLPTTVSTAVDEDPTVPEDFELEQNYPNPFNPRTVIRFSLPYRTAVRLTVVDLLGREVETLVSGEMAEGRHSVSWDAGASASGVYLYRLETGPYVRTRKLVVVR